MANRPQFAPRHDPGSRLDKSRLLSGEAHRLMFFFGALQALAAMAWWTIDLGARYAGGYAPFAWSVPPMWAHAWLLLYGLFPFFILGFLMTAGPNWLGAPKMPRVAFVPAALSMAVGLIFFYAGLSTDHTLAATGVFVHLAGWIWGAAALARLIVRHPSPIAGYAVTLLLFMATGMLGSVVFALSIGAAAYEYVAYSLHSAVWFFLLPIFLGVSTRMVPFFSSRVLGAEVNYRPAWARPALIAGAVAHGMLELAGAHALLWLVDFPMAIVIARLAVAWGLPRSLRVRLLAVLHISLGVLSAVFLLYAALSLAVVAGEASRIGLAPLHLLVIGFFATMLLGMVSRVSLGHSGRALEADPLTWGCYLGLLTAAALRVAAEFSLGTSAGAGFMLGAAAAWLVSFGVWACRYIPMYVSPRVDARERR